jgi:RNA polymerase sigma-70 factor (ECF subfamily)
MSRPAEPDTSPSLLRQVADLRNDVAWQRFIDLYEPLIRGWCGRWRLPLAEQDEAAATVLLKLARELPRFRYDAGGTFRGWLRTVVDHAVQDLLRKRSQTPGARGSGDSAVHEALRQLAADGIDTLVQELDQRHERDRQLLHRGLERVRPRVEPHTWDAFRLTALEGRPGAEVAALLGMKVTAVHMAKSRVCRMLREEVARLERPDDGPA